MKAVTKRADGGSQVDAIKAEMVRRAREIDAHLQVVRRLVDEQEAACASWYAAQDRRPADVHHDYATRGALVRDLSQAVRLALGEWLEPHMRVGDRYSMLSKTDR